MEKSVWTGLLGGTMTLLGCAIYFSAMYEREHKRADAAEAAVLALQKDVARAAPTIVEHDARATKAERELTSCQESTDVLRKLWGMANRDTGRALDVARLLRNQCRCPADMPQVPE